MCDILLEKRDKYLEIKSKHLGVVNERYENAFATEYTHVSTAIEGNTLTLRETSLVINEGISVGGKRLRELYEVRNHYDALNYVIRCVYEELLLDEELVKNIHAQMMKDILIGGVYRREAIRIRGAQVQPPCFQQMYDQIKSFFMELSQKRITKSFTSLDIIELAAWTHAEFVRIHPFNDGNGRTSRLIMNYQLMFHGFPAINIPLDMKTQYFEALEQYDTKKELKLFIEIISSLVDHRLDDYLEAFGHESNISVSL